MATSYSTLLGLALPVQGELSGTWGDTVNNYITNYLDAAVAGTQTLSTDANVTLTKTTGTTLGATSSQYAVINCTGARTVERTITAPAASKDYIIINATTGGFGVKIVGAGPTTGIVVAAGTVAHVAWNGSDFVFVSVITPSGVVPVANGGTGASTSATAPFALKGANSDITSLTGLTTALSVGQGGTGATTAAAAPFALKGANSDITSLTGLTTPLSVGQGGTGTTAGVVTLSGAQTVADIKTFSSSPVIPTPATATNNTQAASTAYVVARVAQDAPTKTGGGASGTWGINVTGSSGSTTGNAATVTTVTAAQVSTAYAGNAADTIGQHCADFTVGAGTAAVYGATFTYASAPIVRPGTWRNLGQNFSAGGTPTLCVRVS